MQAMTGDRERPMEIDSKADWQRLGRLLRQRRPQLDQRYRIRRVFADENHLTDKVMIDGHEVDVVSPDGTPIGPGLHAKFLLGAGSSLTLL